MIGLFENTIRLKTVNFSLKHQYETVYFVFVYYFLANYL